VTPAEPAPAAKIGSLQQSLGRVMRQILDELGLQRVMFAMLTPDRQAIRARYLLEPEHSGLSGFAVSARQPGLFSLLLTKPHGIWINSSNQAKYRPHIPPEVAGLLNPQGYYLVSVVVKGKPIGLFYADAGPRADTMSETQFHQFKQLCLQAAALFEGPG
jgi:hypothetical protein